MLPIAPEFGGVLTCNARSRTDWTSVSIAPAPEAIRRRDTTTSRLKNNLHESAAKAGVKVNADTGKTASAHDLRRSFGQCWAARVMPQILMQLMRHEDISTTMKFYVGREAEATADVLYAAVANLDRQDQKRGNIRGNSGRKPKATIAKNP